MICKDGFELHVGENGYDRVFDHDVIGILNTLLLLGDFRDVEKYSDFILKNVQYPDARWKYSWFFALYLQKTGNIDFVRSNFENIKSNALDIISSISKDGIMKETIAIDSPGHWTVDNFSALTGLICYRYICEKLGEAEESAKAEEAYNTLLKNCESCLKQTIEKYGLDYIPMNMKKPNSETSRSDPRDANRLSMFLFGRWLWDGFLFGGRGSDYINGLIDSTYEHSAKVRENISDSFYNFGGYPHGYFCSAYNAGYGSAALMGSKYRDAGVKAYEFMIDWAQSGPYSWWEGIKFPKDDSPWDIDHASGGGGSCPHMWGQSTAGKVLIDSIICEKADGTLIIGRGVPAEWIYEGSVIEIKKYPVSGGRVNMRAEIRDNKLPPYYRLLFCSEKLFAQAGYSRYTAVFNIKVKLGEISRNENCAYKIILSAFFGISVFKPVFPGGFFCTVADFYAREDIAGIRTDDYIFNHCTLFKGFFGFFIAVNKICGSFNRSIKIIKT